MLFGGNFCPRLYANANGQIVSIAQNSALFSIFGTMYGGDGVTTFGLPNLQGRAPIHAGTLPGGSAYQQGEVGGTTSFSINIQNLPPHNHSATLNASDAPPTDSDPSGNVLAGANIYKAPPAGVAMGPSITIGNTGSGQPIDARSPYQVLRWCVAVEGIYCSRP